MNTINIIDFPEQVIRYIFRYISSKELRVTIRQLYKSFKKHVNDYLQCQGVFALTVGQTEFTRFIHIFKREGKYLETISSVPKSFPKREHIPHFAYYPYDCELYSLPRSLTDMDVPLLMEICFNVVHDQKSSFREDNIFVVTTYLYKFDVAKFSWKNVKATNHIVLGKVMACCPIGCSSMIMAIESYNLDDIPVFNLHLIHLNMNSSNTANYGQIRLDIPEQINTEDGYALIGVAKNTVILISPTLLWQGTLCIENRNINVVWESNNMGQMGVRKNMHCFKLKENVYILGCCNICKAHGSYHCPGVYDRYCDKYNYKEKKFYTNVHSLPHVLTTGSRVSLSLIATDKNETFAVVVFAVEGKTVNIYIFTEKEGFVEANVNYRNIKNIAKRTRLTKTSCSKGRAMTWVGN